MEQLLSPVYGGSNGHRSRDFSIQHEVSAYVVLLGPLCRGGLAFRWVEVSCVGSDHASKGCSLI